MKERKSKIPADRFCKTSYKLNDEHHREQHYNSEQIITTKIPAKVNAQNLQEHKCNSQKCWECNDLLC